MFDMSKNYYQNNKAYENWYNSDIDIINYYQKFRIYLIYQNTSRKKITKTGQMNYNTAYFFVYYNVKIKTK